MTKLAEHLSSTNTTDAVLAAKVGCDRSMITKIKAGKATPSLRLAAAISRETGLPIEALIPASDPCEPAAAIRAGQDIHPGESSSAPIPNVVEAAE
ncbi:XRE family transcriptional regulator [Pseudaminobacter arsenicus]|uniref:XRE family transcriptional regulator n=1 Tax=Borborobacter arsenicus TaxID=1851146 RepID=A0A432V6W5_9HYPH|nr:helix-turn-helix transcriptional regulator [Pseudaminobacter arsenicus]RUM97889.1 XRE family transcriptional regulator [Pseudaminobacter arsenicus]